jgi:gamma-aminobutyric acid type B receptor
LSSFIRSINQPCPGFIAVIGSGCSVATEPAAELSHFWGLSQISYGSSAANLKNRRRFPNYFQLYPSEVDYIPSVVATVDFFGWKRVAVVTQNENLFTQSLPILQQLLEDRNISLMESTPFDSVAFDPDFFQFAGDTHIFFMNSYEDKARQVACAVSIKTQNI